MPRGELFLEVRSEEIPARMLAPAARELGARVFEELLPLELAPSEVETGFTPRRLTLTLKGLPPKEPDREERVTGPPVAVAFDVDGEPTAAARGFARRCGVEVSELGRVKTAKGEYLAADQRTAGRPTPEVLADLLPRLIENLTWPKVMRWGAGHGPWARPIHGVVAIFDREVVDFSLFGVTSGNLTCGHPILSPRPFEVSGAADFRRKMARRGVEVRFDNRRERLLAAMRDKAASHQGELVKDPELLDRLASICGIPGVIDGRFDPGFLTLPREVLIASLRDHQSAFTVEADGELLPVFLTVMDRPDDPQGLVRAGNEWVVAARLADARFFLDDDRKLSLEQRRADLERLTFHARLGSYADKSDRIAKIGHVLCEALEWGEVKAPAAKAAELLKVDLTTEMVKEFTSLQGIMGGVYARLDGHPPEVWQAVYDQYLPASSDDRIPRGRAGQVLALADRIDTLIGIFGLGLVPTGSRDPFGLRRAAQGVVRIALEAELGIDLDLVAAKAHQFFGDGLEIRGKDVLASWRQFLFDRVRHLLGLEGYAYDEIEAGLAVGGSNLPDLKARVDALHQVRGEADFLAVVLAAKRIANIVRDAPEAALNEELLAEPAEKALFAAFNSLRKEVDEAEAAGNYQRCLRAISGFAEVLDRFFVEVLVMDENRDLRDNRVALLQSIQRVLSRTAGLTEMVVDRTEVREREAG